MAIPRPRRLPGHPPAPSAKAERGRGERSSAIGRRRGERACQARLCHHTSTPARPTPGCTLMAAPYRPGWSITITVSSWLSSTEGPQLGTVVDPTGASTTSPPTSWETQGLTSCLSATARARRNRCLLSTPPPVILSPPASPRPAPRGAARVQPSPWPTDPGHPAPGGSARESRPQRRRRGPARTRARTCTGRSPDQRLSGSGAPGGGQQARTRPVPAVLSPVQHPVAVPAALRPAQQARPAPRCGYPRVPRGSRRAHDFSSASRSSYAPNSRGPVPKLTAYGHSASGISVSITG